MTKKVGFILLDGNILSSLDSVLVWIQRIIKIFENESICPGLADNCCINKTEELLAAVEINNDLEFKISDFQPFSKIFGWSYSGNFVIRFLTSERL